MKLINLLLIISTTVFTACGTTDSSLKKQKKSETYITGFHDGRHSGMREAGNNWEHYIKDTGQFTSNADYRQGWLDGEKEGKRLQAQATSIGQTMGNAYSADQINQEIQKSRNFDDIGKAAVRNVDTTALKNLE